MFIITKGGSSYVSEIKKEHGMALGQIAEYLKTFSSAGLLVKEKKPGIRGKRTIYSISPKGMAKLWGYLWRENSLLFVEKKRVVENTSTYKSPKENSGSVFLKIVSASWKKIQKNKNKDAAVMEKHISQLENSKLFQNFLIEYLLISYGGEPTKGVNLKRALFDNFKIGINYVVPNYSLRSPTPEKKKLLFSLGELNRLERSYELVFSLGPFDLALDNILQH